MSTPSAPTSMGTEPTACTASVWNAAPFSWAMRASSAMGWMVPTTLLAYMTDASRVSSRKACSYASTSMTPSPSTGMKSTAHPRRLSARAASMTAGCSMALMMKWPGSKRCR